MTPSSLIQRLPPQFLKNTVMGFGGYPMINLDLRTIFGSQHELSTCFFNSDLWKPLTAAFGRCDHMTAGKYHRARVFGFETQDLYIVCNTETGDRGSGWSCALKKGPRLAADEESNGYAYTQDFRTDQALAENTQKALSELLIRMALAHPPLFDKISPHLPELMALKELEALDEATPKAAPSATKIRV